MSVIEIIVFVVVGVVVVGKSKSVKFVGSV